MPTRPTSRPATRSSWLSRDLQSAPVQAAVEMLVSHCESGTAYLPPPGVGVRLSESVLLAPEHRAQQGSQARSYVSCS